MSSSLSGDPISAVLIPPQLARFRALTGVGSADLEVNVNGWNKYVLLTDDRAFLFPRAPANLEWFIREVTIYGLLPPDLTVVPRVLGVWHEPDVYALPFAVVTRLPGTHPEDASALMADLGGAIARWHALEPTRFDLANARPPAHHDRPATQWLRRALDPATTRAAAREAADRLHRHDAIARWTEQLGRAAQHPPVLVHGDIHEDQLLARAGVLTGVLDWETARIDHPFWDFDFGEWGTGLWRRHRSEFSALWATAWRAYADRRAVDPDPAPLETAFRLRHALALLEHDGVHDPGVVGTIGEHLRALDA